MAGDADLSDRPPVELLMPALWPGTLVPNFSQWQAAGMGCSTKTQDPRPKKAMP